MIVNGWKHIGGYDLETGKEVWRMTGGGDIPVPTPITGQGLVFITNAHGKMSPIYAIKPTATGDISLKEGETSNQHIAWSYARDGAYMQTPIFYGDILYVCRDNGVLSAFDAKTGQRHYQARLGNGSTGFSASAVAAAGRIYYTSEDGDVYVVKAGPAFELLATNSAGRGRDGDAGDFGRGADFPHPRTTCWQSAVASRGFRFRAARLPRFALLFRRSASSQASASRSNHAIGPSAA